MSGMRECCRLQVDKVQALLQEPSPGTVKPSPPTSPMLFAKLTGSHLSESRRTLLNTSTASQRTAEAGQHQQDLCRVQAGGLYQVAHAVSYVLTLFAAVLHISSPKRSRRVFP